MTMKRSGLTLPLSMLIFGVYFLGMFAGGVAVGFLKTLLRKAKGSPSRTEARVSE
jgi:hypothetical protein